MPAAHLKPLVIPVFIPHAGCPHQCAFCNQSILTRHLPDIVDVKTIHHTIHKYLQYQNRRKPVELAFFGGNFLGLPQADVTRLLEAVQPYIHEKKIDGIRFSTRPDTITAAHLEQIRQFNVHAVELGVQSMDDRVLQCSRRGHTREDTILAIDLLKKASIKTGVQVMVGLPGDTEELALKSTTMLIRLAPDFARIYPLVVLNGSLVAKWFQQGRYQPLSLESAVHQARQMYQMFTAANIRVIRMGLQSSDLMEDRLQVLAGPWHPAFGHLVLSAVMYEEMTEKINDCLKQGGTGHLVIRVHPRCESRTRGHQNSHFEKLHRQYPQTRFSIALDPEMALDQVDVSDSA